MTDFDVVVETSPQEYTVEVSYTAEAYEVSVELGGFLWPTASFVFNQAIPSDVWVIDHNMGKYPSVFCTDSSDDEIVGDIKHTSVNTVTITYAFPTGGKAFLN